MFYLRTLSAKKRQDLLHQQPLDVKTVLRHRAVLVGEVVTISGWFTSESDDVKIRSDGTLDMSFLANLWWPSHTDMFHMLWNPEPQPEERYRPGIRLPFSAEEAKRISMGLCANVRERHISLGSIYYFITPVEVQGRLVKSSYKHHKAMIDNVSRMNLLAEDSRPEWQVREIDFSNAVD